MSTTAAELQQKRLQQAEELLFSGPQKAGFAKELFFGRFLTPAMLPYPQLSSTEYENRLTCGRGSPRVRGAAP